MTKHRLQYTSERPVEDRILYTISWTLKVAPQRLLPYTHFVEDLHLDQLDMTLLIADLESQLNVFLSQDEVASIETISDANKLFRKHLTASAVAA